MRFAYETVQAIFFAIQVSGARRKFALRTSLSRERRPHKRTPAPGATGGGFGAIRHYGALRASARPYEIARRQHASNLQKAPGIPETNREEHDYSRRSNGHSRQQSVAVGPWDRAIVIRHSGYFRGYPLLLRLLVIVSLRTSCRCPRCAVMGKNTQVVSEEGGRSDRTRMGPGNCLRHGIVLFRGAHAGHGRGVGSRDWDGPGPPAFLQRRQWRPGMGMVAAHVRAAPINPPTFGVTVALTIGDGGMAHSTPFFFSVSSK